MEDGSKALGGWRGVLTSTETVCSKGSPWTTGKNVKISVGMRRD